MGKPSLTEQQKKLRRTRKYWRDNAEEINRRRRERYAKSKKLREEHRARCKEQYAQRQKEKPHPKRLLRRLPRRAKLQLDKRTTVEIYVVPISYFAKRLGVARDTIRRWEAKGIIPKMGWRGHRQRYWPVLFIEITREVIRELAPEGPAQGVPLAGRGIPQEIVKRWKKRKSIYKQNPEYGGNIYRLQPPKDGHGEEEKIGGTKKANLKAKRTG